MTTRPQLASSPAKAVFTSGELAIERAIFLAATSFSAPVTVTSTILRAPSLYHIPTPLLNRMKMETKLVKQGEPRGFWLRVRMRSAEELSAGGEHPAA